MNKGETYVLPQWYYLVDELDSLDFGIKNPQKRKDFFTTALNIFGVNKDISIYIWLLRIIPKYIADTALCIKNTIKTKNGKKLTDITLNKPTNKKPPAIPTVK